MNDHVVAATATVYVLVIPETTTAFAAYDAVVAYDDVPANCDETEPV